METVNYFQKFLKEERYTQSFNSAPIFLNHSAQSGFVIKEILGFGYNGFCFNYKEGYGEMDYLVSDFKMIWRIIKNKLAQDPDYLIKTKKQYEEIFNEHEKLFEKIAVLKLREIKNEELFDLFKKCAKAQIDSVGLGHLVDSISIELEKEFRKKLFDEIEEKKEFNKYFVQLTVPSKPSFIAKEENELLKISLLSSSERKENLKEHLKKYFWIQNSYAGPKKLTINSLEQRLRFFRETKKKQKNKIIRVAPKVKIKLSKEVKKMVETIDFTTIWQDERKRNALKTIGYWGKIIDEIGRRLSMPSHFIYYLGVSDVEKINFLKDIGSLRKNLERRIKGVFFLLKEDREIKITGALYQKLIKIRKKITESATEKQKEIHGTIANNGTAIGRVIICKDINSLDKVRAGDILVTSMTRPEFMPALKKATAIVTDEGGITSHAAIVARELGIPAIIGTKIATKVLKDGMVVEVRANHGVIKIIG